MFARKIILLCTIIVPVAVSFGQAPTKKSHRKAGGQTAPGQNGEKKTSSDAGAGKLTYEKRCAICHLADSDDNKVGPGLKGLGKRERFKSGEPISDESLRTWIENGGKGMPGFKTVLSPKELHDLIAYLKTL
jgi:cytochrome c2